MVGGMKLNHLCLVMRGRCVEDGRAHLPHTSVWGAVRSATYCGDETRLRRKGIAKRGILLRDA